MPYRLVINYIISQNVIKQAKNIIMFLMIDDIVAMLNELYLTTSGIIMQSLDKSNMPKSITFF